MLLSQPGISLLARLTFNLLVKRSHLTGHIRKCTSSILVRNLSTSNICRIDRYDPSKTEEKKEPDNTSSQALQFNDEDTEDSIYDREFAELTIECFEELYKDDTSGMTRGRIEVVLREYEFLKYNSEGRVPSNIDVSDMLRLLEEGFTPTAREKCFTFLYKREMTKRNSVVKKLREKAEKAAVRSIKVADINERSGGIRSGLVTNGGELVYGLWHNSLFPRIHENKLKNGLSARRLIGAAMFGPKLVFDFDFEDHMVPWVNRNSVDQVQEAYGLNRFHYKEPYDIWFCNFNKDSKTGEYAKNYAIRNLYDGSMITVKNGCFTEYFDKSRLVYLSPDAREVLDTVNKNDDIYVIGVYNDKGTAKPLTYRKAVSLGVRCKRLPLDAHVAWQGGTKSLCINHVTGILLETMHNGGNWQKAFLKHIPPRKIKPIEVIIEEEKIRMSKPKFRKKARRFSIRDDLG